MKNFLPPRGFPYEGTHYRLGDVSTYTDLDQHRIEMTVLYLFLTAQRLGLTKKNSAANYAGWSGDFLYRQLRRIGAA